VLELYAGAGLFTVALAAAVGPSGRVIGLEGSRQAVADATANLVGQPWAQVAAGRIEPPRIAEVLAESGVEPDLVVLDPPRSGAGPAVLSALLERAPRAIGYVACDPAALARDLRVALDAGWRLASVRAFDAFPMTHHLECVAVLHRPIGPSTT
jgi:tRNA/tmRNA/rRNA uracil-C5-methylase (TrmA/RlmC/RlmD family)